MDDKYRKEYLDTLNEMRERDADYFTTQDNAMNTRMTMETGKMVV